MIIQSFQDYCDNCKGVGNSPCGPTSCQDIWDYLIKKLSNCANCIHFPRFSNREACFECTKTNEFKNWRME